MSRISQNGRRSRLPGLDLNMSPQSGIRCSKERLVGTQIQKRGQQQERLVQKQKTQSCSFAKNRTHDHRQKGSRDSDQERFWY